MQRRPITPSPRAAATSPTLVGRKLLMQSLSACRCRRSFAFLIDSPLVSIGSLQTLLVSLFLVLVFVCLLVIWEALVNASDNFLSIRKCVNLMTSETVAKQFVEKGWTKWKGGIQRYVLPNLSKEEPSQNLTFSPITSPAAFRSISNAYHLPAPNQDTNMHRTTTAKK